MKRYFKKMMQSIILLLKISLYLCILFTFLLLFSINNFAVFNLSRTMGTTIFSFVFSGIVMTGVYGRFDIGRRKTKPIIISFVLATLFTDIFTYIQLMIMNTISYDVRAFKFTDFEILILVYIIQVIWIVLFTNVGNAIYFSVYDPEKCCIITNRDADLSKISASIKKYKKQYNVERVLDYRRKDLEEIILQMDTVFFFEIPAQRRLELINYCYEKDKNTYIVPEIADVVEKVSEHYLLDDVSFLNHNRAELSIEQRIIKRTFDIVIALVAGVVSSPFWIISAIAIKVGDGGSILFKQERATKNGKVFKVYKFRTMKENVENRSASTDDDRITKVGKILRKTRLDEVPQIINILKGDMSIVGPRPEMLENVRNYAEELPEFNYRLKVKGGLTGYAQIAGKYNTSPKDKLILDMMYIENFSIWNDLKLMFQTAIVLLKADSTEGFMTIDNVFVCEETPEDKLI